MTSVLAPSLADDPEDLLADPEDEASPLGPPIRQPPRKVPNLPPPSSYKRLYSSYAEEWAQRRKRLAAAPHTKILDVIFHHQNSLLIAATDRGRLLVWKTASSSFQDEFWGSIELEVPSKQASTTTKPTSGPLRALQVHQRNCGESSGPIKTKTMLLVGGKGGVWCLPDLEELLQHAPTNDERLLRFSDGRKPAPSWYPLRWEAIDYEVSELILSSSVASEAKDDLLYVLGPNRVHIYSLSNQHLLYSLAPGIMTGTARGTLWTTMALAKDPSHYSSLAAAAEEPIVLIGTSDSRLLVWKPEQSEEADNGAPNVQVEILDLHRAVAASPKGPSPPLPTDLPLSVTSICVTHGQWWTIAAAVFRRPGEMVHKVAAADPESTSTSGGDSGSTEGCWGGLLSTWHGPTKTLVSVATTRETLQCVAAASVPSSSPALYTIGNERCLTEWESAYHLSRTSRVWTTSPSGTVLRPVPGGGEKDDQIETTMLVVGVGSSVDLFRGVCKRKTLFLPTNS